MKLHHCRNTVISTSSSLQLVPMSDVICRCYDGGSTGMCKRRYFVSQSQEEHSSCDWYIFHLKDPILSLLLPSICPFFYFFLPLSITPPLHFTLSFFHNVYLVRNMKSVLVLIRTDIMELLYMSQEALGASQVVQW